MGQWKNLPREVVQEIAQELEDYTEEEWTFVNKQLFEIYLSQKFGDIDISLDQDSDDKFKVILTSRFNVGQWVKKLYVYDFSAPKDENLDNLNKSQDPLYLLMKHCPSVKSFDFQSTVLSDRDDAKNWEYFLAVLKNCDTWKLKELPSTPSISNSAHQHTSIALTLCEIRLQNSI